MKMIILITLLLIIMVSLFIKYYSKKTLPILISYAKSETKKLTVLIINKAITKEVTSLEPDELFDIIYTQDGDIQMIDFNSQNTNKILSTMTSVVEQSLQAIEEGNLSKLNLPDNSLSAYNKNLLEQGIIFEIPFGIATQSSLLYNLGPKVPVRLSLVGNATANFDTKIEEYGINSAMLKVLVDIEVTTRIIMPVVTDEITITCSIPVAVKIIQGKIPDYYMNGFTTKSNVIGEN